MALNLYEIFRMITKNGIYIMCLIFSKAVSISCRNLFVFAKKWYKISGLNLEFVYNISDLLWYQNFNTSHQGCIDMKTLSGDPEKVLSFNPSLYGEGQI